MNWNTRDKCPEKRNTFYLFYSLDRIVVYNRLVGMGSIDQVGSYF